MKLVEKFLDYSDASNIFAELKTLQFYRPKFSVCGKEILASRKIFPVGDARITYAFPDEIAFARPWPSAVLQIKQKVETYLNCEFNFALLNLYPNDESNLAHQRLNAECLDKQCSIATLFLGGDRSMQIKKDGDDSSSELCLKHTSLVIQSFLDNLMCTSSILKGCDDSSSITITFLKIVQAQPTYKKRKIDWLDRLFKMQNRAIHFSQHCAVFIKEFHNQFYVDIRRIDYKGSKCFPIKIGIMMSAFDFFALKQKIKNCAFSSESNGLANHIILMYFEEHLHLQRINVDNDQHLTLDSKFLKLDRSEVKHLQEKIDEISIEIVEALWEDFLPIAYYKIFDDENLISSDADTIAKAFLAIVEHSLTPIVQSFFPCQECSSNCQDLSKHACENTSMREQFERSDLDLLSLVNMNDIVQKCAEVRLFSSRFIEGITVEYLQHNLFKE